MESYCCKAILGVVALLLPVAIWAQGQIPAQTPPYLNQEYPTQQFVIGESEEQPSVVTNNTQPANAVNSPASRTQVANTPPDNPIAVEGTAQVPLPANAPVSTIGSSGVAPGLDQQFPVPEKPQPLLNPADSPLPAPGVASAVGVNNTTQAETPPSGLFSAGAATAENYVVATKKPIDIFKGGLEERGFVQCQKMTASVCSRANTNQKFYNCLNLLKPQSGCAQFIAFAGLSGYGVKDDMDVFQNYKEANIFLIHITRGATDYPGDYFVISNNGDFTNINSGPEAQAIDITGDPNYEAIKLRYPQVQLWSLIDKQPRLEPSVRGSGVRLIFSFQLRNGCPNCDLAGFADIAFDFADDGSLKQAVLLKIRDTNSS